MSNDLVFDDTSNDLDLIVPLENITDIPENIRDQYVMIDTDSENMYHTSLFSNKSVNNVIDSTSNTNFVDIDENLAKTVNEFSNPNTFDYVESDLDDEYRDEYRDECHDDYHNDYQQIMDEEEENYRMNKPTFDLIDSTVDTRNRTGEFTKSDYRSSNSFIRFRSNTRALDPEISSNIEEVMGGLNKIRTDKMKRPITIIDEMPFALDTAAKFNHGRGYGLRNSDIGDSIFFKLVEALEEHSVSKVERKDLYDHRPRKIIKYKVPILRWEPINFVDESRQRSSGPTNQNKVKKQREYEDDLGKGIYRVHTSQSTIQITNYKGSPETITETIINGVTKVAEFKDADIPKGICPIDFRASYSSTKYQNARCKIFRSSVYDTESKQMISTGNAVNRGGTWQPSTDSDKEYLIVDLGKNMSVTHISTMGDTPPITPFPEAYYDRHTRFSEDYDGPDPKRKELIYVLTHSDPHSRYRRSYLQFYNPYQSGKWVESYELLVRPDHGKWICVGLYRGNTDPYCEIIHDIRRDLNDMKIRYLKFVPKTYHIGIAMRVDVFSSASEIETMDTIDRNHIIYTLEMPVGIGMKNGTELTRKFRVNYYDRWDGPGDENLNRLERNAFIKSELDTYNANKNAYLDLYATPNRDLHVYKYDSDREEREIKEAVARSTKNRQRRQAYHRRHNST